MTTGDGEQLPWRTAAVGGPARRGVTTTERNRGQRDRNVVLPADGGNEKSNCPSPHGESERWIERGGTGKADAVYYSYACGTREREVGALPVATKTLVGECWGGYHCPSLISGGKQE